MIKLEINTENSIVFTGSTASGSTYTFNISSISTNDDFTFTILDTSLYPSRYNIGQIYCLDSVDTFDSAIKDTIEDGEVYVVIGDVIGDPDLTVESGGILLYSGSMGPSASAESGGILATVGATAHSQTNSINTVLWDIPYGYLSYTITDMNEIGEILYNELETTTTTTTYTGYDDTRKTYNG